MVLPLPPLDRNMLQKAARYGQCDFTQKVFHMDVKKTVAIISTLEVRSEDSQDILAICFELIYFSGFVCFSF